MFKIEVRKINKDFTEIPQKIVFRKNYDSAFDVYDFFIEQYSRDYVIEITETKICKHGYGKKDA